MASSDATRRQEIINQGRPTNPHFSRLHQHHRHHHRAGHARQALESLPLSKYHDRAAPIGAHEPRLGRRPRRHSYTAPQPKQGSCVRMHPFFSSPLPQMCCPEQVLQAPGKAESGGTEERWGGQDLGALFPCGFFCDNCERGIVVCAEGAEACDVSAGGGEGAQTLWMTLCYSTECTEARDLSSPKCIAIEHANYKSHRAFEDVRGRPRCPCMKKRVTLCVKRKAPTVLSI